MIAQNSLNSCRSPVKHEMVISRIKVLCVIHDICYPILFFSEKYCNQQCHDHFVSTKARMKALRTCYPDIQEDEVNPKPLSKMYSRPISEPPSPSMSRHTTPAPSLHGSDDERDDDQVR